MRIRLLISICAGVLLLVLYVSLEPFDFSADWTVVSDRFAMAMESWRYATRSDLVSNFLLYVPIGFLGATLLTIAGLPRLWSAAVAAVVAAAFSAGIETAQLFSPSRLATIHDVVMNSAGGAVGAAAGAVVGRWVWMGAVGLAERHFHPRKVTVAAFLLCGMLTANGLSPMTPVRDRSEMAANIRGSDFSLGQGLAQHTWHHWVVCRVGVFAVLAILVGASVQAGGQRWFLGVLLVCAFAAILEAAKVSIIHRNANIANVAVGCIGATVGGIVAGILHRRMSYASIAAAGAVLILGYLAYWEWFSDFRTRVPFDLEAHPVGSAQHQLYVYELMYLLVKVVLLSAAMTSAWCISRSRKVLPVSAARLAKGAVTAVLVGSVLEFGRYILFGSPLDMLELVAFGIGGGGGVWAAGMRGSLQPMVLEVRRVIVCPTPESPR
ncbi:MAG: VanZ family protein [Planctomycetota bacterium]|nr:VanZ family protein [Planctomycetota bacterium]